MSTDGISAGLPITVWLSSASSPTKYYRWCERQKSSRCYVDKINKQLPVQMGVPPSQQKSTSRPGLLLDGGTFITIWHDASEGLFCLQYRVDKGLKDQTIYLSTNYPNSLYSIFFFMITNAS